MLKKTYLVLKQSISKNPWFLLLLPVFFVYSGYNELFGFLSFGYVFKSLLVILLAVAVIYIIVYLLIKNSKKASVYSFFITLLCLLFGFLHDSLKSITSFFFLTKYTIILPFLALCFIIAFFIIRNSRNKFTDLFLFLNLLFIILILSEIPNSIKRYQLDKSVHNLIDFRFNASNIYKPVHQLVDSAKPDIFLIVFDALGSSKSIQEKLGYDNSRLDSLLRQQGFFVAKNAKANYNGTIYSICTMFNMDHLPQWIIPVMNDPKIPFWGTETFKSNSLYRILKSENYKIHNYQPLSFDNPDWPGPPYFGYFKTEHFYYKTLPGRLHRDVFWNFIHTDIGLIRKRQVAEINKRNKLQKQLLDTTITLLKDACSLNPQPKFVYAHFMVTHDPYLFDSTGNILKDEDALLKNKTNTAKNYFTQVKLADSIIADVVTHIKTKNKKNTIIIVAGDHGFPNELLKKFDYSFDTFSSFYFPDQQYETLNDSIQPINTFRVILNHFYGTKYPLFEQSTISVTTGSLTDKKEVLSN